MTVRQTNKGIRSCLVVLVCGAAASLSALAAAVAAAGNAAGVW